MSTLLADSDLEAIDAVADDGTIGSEFFRPLVAEVRAHRALGVDQLVERACRPLLQRIVALEQNLEIHRRALRSQRERFEATREVTLGESRREALAGLPASSDDDLDPRERAVLRAIVAGQLRHGVPPTYREIGGMAGLTSTGTVTVILGTLQSRGYLAKGDLRRRRAIVLRKLPEGFLGEMDPVVEEEV